jgi:hypothetical protein
MAKKLARASWLPDLILLVGALVLYIHTLAPTVLPADSGEFQYVSALLGIAHPPGYPLYTLLGKLFTLLPVGAIAYRVNLLSAIAAALALVGLGRLVREATRSVWAGLAAALALGGAATFWAQATTANIRALTAFFVAWQLYFLFCYGERREKRALYLFALAFGLGIGHHGSLAFLAIPYAIYLLWMDRGLWLRWREWIGPLGVFLASFVVLLYLPLRSLMGAPFDAAPIRSLSGFLDHVLARGFGGDMFAFATLADLRDRLPVLLNILVMQFGEPLLAVALLGAIGGLWRNARLTVLFGGVFIINAFVAITYRAPQTVEYSLPADVALAGMIGCVGFLLTAVNVTARRIALARALSVLILIFALGLGLGNLAGNYTSYRALSRDRSTREYAENLLNRAPEGALILANWHYATPLWYLQYVEGLRRDVEVRYLNPEGATPMGQLWARYIQENADSRAVILTNHYQEFDSLPYRFLPFYGAEQAIVGPLREIPAGMTPLDILFEDKIRFVGYQLSSESVASGDDLLVRLCWQPSQPLTRDYSFFVHLVSPAGGAPLGQGDKTHAAARYQVGEIVVDEYRFSLTPATPPGDYTLLAGVYITLPEGGWQRLRTAVGQDAVNLASVTVSAPTRAPLTAHPLYAAFPGGLRCLGVDYDISLPGNLRVYLHWHRPSEAHESSQALLYRNGQLAAQAMLPSSKGYATIALDLPAAPGELTLELRQGESALAPSGLWRLVYGRHVRLPAPTQGERHIVLGGEMTLKAATWESEWSAQQGRVMLHFQSLRPLTRDYAVSVSLVGADGRFLAQHDTTPALGAIPTLKWIRGTEVDDLHLITVPAAYAGEAILRLTVYDAFTLQPLAVADERLSKLGQGVQIEMGKVIIK